MTLPTLQPARNWPGCDAGHCIVPGDVVEGLDRSDRRDFQSKARFAGPFLEYEVPAGIASCAFHLVDGQIEAEEEDVIRRAAPDRAACESSMRGGCASPLPASASRVHAGANHLGVLGEDHRVWVLLQQFAANDEHSLRWAG